MATRYPWSFNVHFHDVGLDDDDPKPSKEKLDAALVVADKAFAAIRDLGGTFVRTDFPWKLVQPEQPDSTGTKFNKLVIEFCRSYVEAAGKHGIEVICILYQTPTWAKTVCERDPNAFYLYYKDYCKTIAKAMEGKVRYYQLWNEPNNIFTFLNGAKDQFATKINFPLMFHIAETGLHEAGYPWETMLNFLVNAVTELEAFTSVIDATFGTLVNVLTGIRDVAAFLGILDENLSRTLNQAVNDLGAMENLYANSFSWKRAINYYVDMNHVVNPNNRINIYGIDHYPGTWSPRQYEDWSPLNDTATIISRHGKSLAVLETGFTTWEMNEEIKPSVEILEQFALMLTMSIAQPIIDIIKFVFDAILSLIPEPFKSGIVKLIPTADQIRELFKTNINPTIVGLLKSIYINGHTYNEQAVWIDRAIGGLYANPHCSSLKFINWYELKDQDSKPPQMPKDIGELFDIPEKKFGILLMDGTPKKAYQPLKEQIHR